MFCGWKTIFIVFVMALCSCVPAAQEVKSEAHQADVHYKLAMAHLQADNPTLALKELLEAVKQDPENSSIQVALAQTYQIKKAYPQAESHYLKALELDKNEPRFQNNLASLYLEMEEWDKAIDYFSLAAENLLFVNAHVAVAGKSYAYFKKKDFATALTYANESLEISPRYASAYYLKSEIYHEIGDIDQEKFCLQRAIDVAPQFLSARYQLAILLLQENSVAEAAAQLKIITDVSPTTEIGHKANNILKTLPDY
ncbi:Tfp pilus assembly protein PilF [Desulfuromusa kysingii]|uniref:Tfp pilus assembly protein PilF n=1 Tax=Desulfuromusa kysingii TaxID=37625 RepID=A0A1H4BGA4_9BACT|nr:tetratricopeptide repeat protein [Desulfuromusa kysingii]SEA46832.1 Tfp pilus assembly protein PilF [Desulfuromusa kysingii]